MTDTITLPRSVVTSALHALDLSQGLLASAKSIHHTTVLEEYKSLRAALAEQAEQGWQPIETAPKDGTRVLVFRLLRGEPQIEGAKYRDDIGAWGDGSWSYPSYASPTHWMPLPAAPKGVA